MQFYIFSYENLFFTYYYNYTLERPYISYKDDLESYFLM